MRKFICLLSAVASLSAYGNDAQTKDWYVQHDKERTARVAECRNDAQEGAKPDCMNAQAAQSQVATFGKGKQDYSFDLKLDEK